MKKFFIEILQKLGLLKISFRIHELIKRTNPFVILRNTRYLRTMTSDGIPIPPLRLIVLVTGNADIPAFLEGGKLAVQSIIGILEKNGLDIKNFGQSWTLVADAAVSFDTGIPCKRQQSLAQTIIKN